MQFFCIKRTPKLDNAEAKRLVAKKNKIYIDRYIDRPSAILQQ